MKLKWLWLISLACAGLFSCTAERLAKKALRKDPEAFNLNYRPVQFDLTMKFDRLETVKYLSKVDSFFLEKDWPDTIKEVVIREIPKIIKEVQEIPMQTDTASYVWPDSSWVQAWVYRGKVHIVGELASVQVKKKEKFWQQAFKYTVGFGVGVLVVFLLLILWKIKL